MLSRLDQEAGQVDHSNRIQDTTEQTRQRRGLVRRYAAFHRPALRIHSDCILRNSFSILFFVPDFELIRDKVEQYLGCSVSVAA